MPLNQVASISAPEPRMLTVQVWDKSNVGPVDKAIRSAGLGLNPIVDGQMLRLPIPEMTQERRKELSKLAGQYAEKARVAVRSEEQKSELQSLMRITYAVICLDKQKTKETKLAD